LEVPADALLQVSIGVLKRDLGDDVGALVAFERARDMFKESGGGKPEMHKCVAGLLLRIAMIKHKSADLIDALAAYEEAKKAITCAGSMQSRDGLLLMESFGQALYSCECYLGASDAFTEAVQLREDLGLLSTPSGVQLLHCLSRTLRKCRKLDFSVKVYKRALEVCAEAGVPLGERVPLSCDLNSPRIEAIGHKEGPAFT